MYSYVYSLTVPDSTFTSYSTGSSSSSTYTEYGLGDQTYFYLNITTGTTSDSYTASETTSSTIADYYGTFTGTCDWSATTSSQTWSATSGFGAYVTVQEETTLHSTNGTHTVSASSRTLQTLEYNSFHTAVCGYTYYYTQTSSSSSGYGSWSSTYYETINHAPGGTHSVYEKTVFNTLLASGFSSYTQECDFGQPVTVSDSSYSSNATYTYETFYTTTHGSYGYHTVSTIYREFSSTTTTATKTFALATETTQQTSYVRYARITRTQIDYETVSNFQTVSRIGTNCSTRGESYSTYRSFFIISNTGYEYTSGSYTLTVDGGVGNTRLIIQTGYSNAAIYSFYTATGDDQYTGQTYSYETSGSLASTGLSVTDITSLNNVGYTSISNVITQAVTAYPAATMFYSYYTVTNAGGFTNNNYSTFSTTTNISSYNPTSSSVISEGWTYTYPVSSTYLTSASTSFANTITVATSYGSLRTSTTTTADSTLTSAPYTANVTSTSYTRYTVTTSTPPYTAYATSSVSRMPVQFTSWIRSNGEIIYVPTMTDWGTRVLSDAGFTTTALDGTYYSGLNASSYSGVETYGYTTITSATVRWGRTQTTMSARGQYSTGTPTLSLLPNPYSTYTAIGQALDRKNHAGNPDVSVFGLKLYANKTGESVSIGSGGYDLTINSSTLQTAYTASASYVETTTYAYRYHPLYSIVSTTDSNIQAPHAFVTSSTITML